MSLFLLLVNPSILYSQEKIEAGVNNYQVLSTMAAEVNSLAISNNEVVIGLGREASIISRMIQEISPNNAKILGVEVEGNRVRGGSAQSTQLKNTFTEMLPEFEKMQGRKITLLEVCSQCDHVWDLQKQLEGFIKDKNLDIKVSTHIVTDQIDFKSIGGRVTALTGDHKAAIKTTSGELPNWLWSDSLSSTETSWQSKIKDAGNDMKLQDFNKRLTTQLYLDPELDKKFLISDVQNFRLVQAKDDPDLFLAHMISLNDMEGDRVKRFSESIDLLRKNPQSFIAAEKVMRELTNYYPEFSKFEKLKSKIGMRPNKVSIDTMGQVALKELSLFGSKYPGGLGPDMNQKLARLYTEYPVLRPQIRDTWEKGGHTPVKEIKEVLLKDGSLDAYVTGSKIGIFKADDLMKRIKSYIGVNRNDAILKFSEELYDHPPFFDMFVSRGEKIRVGDEHRLAIVKTFIWNEDRLTPKLNKQYRPDDYRNSINEVRQIYRAVVKKDANFMRYIFHRSYRNLQEEDELHQDIKRSTEKIIEARKAGKLKSGMIVFRDALTRSIGEINFYPSGKSPASKEATDRSQLHLSLAVAEAGGAGEIEVLRHLGAGVKTCKPGCTFYDRLQNYLKHEDLRSARVEYLLSNATDEDLIRLRKIIEETPASPCGPVFN